MKQTRIHILCESAILIALAVVLSLVSELLLGTVTKPLLPWGGSITLFSMLPICIISIKHSLGWGLTSAFCFSWFQILQGQVLAWGLTPGMLVASLFLDYILAYTVLGLAGILRKKGYVGMLIGTTTVCLLRFGSHFLSGIVLWANMEQFVAFGETWVNRPVLYSLVYNGSYMLPETVLTVAGAAILFRIPQVKRLIKL